MASTPAAAAAGGPPSCPAPPPPLPRFAGLRVELDASGRVGLLTLNRPQAANAFDAAMFEDFPAARCCPPFASAAHRRRLARSLARLLTLAHARSHPDSS
jgi:hypothetical protein